jgi:DNA-binding NtrC family response regulator
MATLLIVDDDTRVREVLHDLLSPSHECHSADRAAQAMTYLEIEKYDAVITDVSMPGLSGRTLLMHVQAKHPTVPVIVISGMPGEENRADGQELLDLGAFAFFAKPFKLEDIEAAVERAISEHQKLASEVNGPDQNKDDEAEADAGAPGVN